MASRDAVAGPRRLLLISFCRSSWADTAVSVVRSMICCTIWWRQLTSLEVRILAAFVMLEMDAHEALDCLYRCNACQDLTEATKVDSFDFLSSVIVFHLNRTQWNSRGKSKITQRISFPLHKLDLSSLALYKTSTPIVSAG